MNKFLVEITSDAYADLESIYNYIAYVLHSPQNAINQYKRIAEAIFSLDSFPYRYGCFRSDPEQSIQIHKMVVDNYVVCYVIEAEQVTVLNVFYGASDIHRKLEGKYKKPE